MNESNASIHRVVARAPPTAGLVGRLAAGVARLVPRAFRPLWPCEVSLSGREESGSARSVSISLAKRTDRLKREVQKLKEQQRRLQLEIAEYRAKLYKAKARPAPEKAQAPHPPRKRGAPKGHPGWSRPVPRHADRHVEVTVEQCPECGGRDLKACKRYEDHYQEDIVLPQVEVTRFRKHFYYCRNCGEVVSGVGERELPGSYTGPLAKSVASFLHFQMKVPYRKLRILFRDLLHLSFTPSAAPGFDGQIRRRGAPLYEQMRQRLPAEPVAHVDETGWRKEGVH